MKCFAIWYALCLPCLQLVSRGDTVMKALYDFNPSNQGEMSLQEGQVGEIIAYNYVLITQTVYTRPLFRRGGGGGWGWE